MPVTGDALGVGTEDAVKRLRPGEVLLLENLRFHAEEEENDPAFAAALAAYADVYVNDAFGTAHRAHASTVGIAKLLPAYAGPADGARDRDARRSLLESPERPFAAILGGAKVSDKIEVIDHLADQGRHRSSSAAGWPTRSCSPRARPIGKSLAEPDRVEDARRILVDRREATACAVILPVDVIVAKEVTRGTEYKTLPAEKIPASWHIVDLGKASQDLMVEAPGRRQDRVLERAARASSRSRRSPTARRRVARLPRRPRRGRRDGRRRRRRLGRRGRPSRAWPTG